MSLSDDKQADVIDNFNTSSRYFDDILNIHDFYFDNMVSQIYPCMWHELTSVPCVRVVKTLVLLHGFTSELLYLAKSTRITRSGSNVNMSRGM